MLKAIVGGCVRGGGRLVVAAGLAIAAVAVTVPTSTVQAQPGGGMMGMFGGMGGRGQGNDPTYTSKDLERAGEMLGFDASQKEAAKTFLDSYQTAFTEEAGKLQKAIEKAREAMREDNDPSAWDGVRKAGEEMAVTKKKLDAEFVENLQAVCNDDQKAKWPKFERMQRREQGLERGAFLSGERVNVMGILEKMELSTEIKGSLATVLDQYETDLDRELVARAKVQEELQADAQKMFGNMRGMRDLQNLDMGKIDELITKGRDASVRVREVNGRYAKQIEGMLPADSRAAFAAEVKKQSFPEVYRQTRTARSLEAAMGFGDLTADQKTQIEAIKTKYAADLVPMNEKMSEAQAKTEMEMTAEKMMNFMGDQDSPVAELRRKKRELGTAADESLKKILTEEQIKRLPADGGNEGDRPGGRRGGGAGGAGGAGGGDGGGGRRPARPAGGGGGGGGGGF
jgi:hypothetical protein